MIRREVIINQGLFQGCWFACVLGAAHGLIWPGLLMTVVLAIWQLAPRNRHPADLPVVAVALFIGVIADSAWVALDVLAYATPWPSSDLAPAWILLLWIAFALTLNHSLSFLAERPWLAAVLAGAGSPLSYFAGLNFGAVEWVAPAPVVVAVAAVSWALIVPALFAFTRFWVGNAAPGGIGGRALLESLDDSR